MAAEGNLPPRDTRWAKVAPPVEHRALEEILSVDNDTKNKIPHFQCTSF